MYRSICSWASLCLVTVLGGCAASASPDWDAAFGDRSRTLKAQQLINTTAASSNGQSVTASDGRTVREASERHLETYRNPPPPTVINIGVGGGR